MFVLLFYSSRTFFVASRKSSWASENYYLTSHKPTGKKVKVAPWPDHFFKVIVK